MNTFSQTPIRLEADLVSAPPVVPIDQNTGLPIKFWARQGIAIAIGVFDADGLCVDLSNVEYLQLVIQTSQSALAPSVVKNVLAGSIIPTITRAAWEAGTAQQATVVLSNAETDLSLGGADSATYWLALQGRTTAGANIVYAAGPITVYNPGPYFPSPTIGLTSWHTQNSAGDNVLVSPSSPIHSELIVVSGAAGTRDVVVDATGQSPGALVNLRFQLPAAAGIVHRVFDQSISGDLLAVVTSDPDGFTPAVRIGLVYDGSELRRDFLIIPAFGQQN